MIVFLAGAGLLLASFLVQLVWWRLALPRSQTRALLVVFAVTPLCALAGLAAAGHALPLGPATATRLVLAYIAFTLAYVVLYSAIEQQSPTLAIVSLVSDEDLPGCTTDELLTAFTRAETMSGRVVLMERSGMVYADGEVIRLTSQGRIYANLFEHAGKIFGLAKGG